MSWFTFHYVSIKTKNLFYQVACHIYLHSTMYLLKLLASAEKILESVHLHSTMYLLKRFIRREKVLCSQEFTFHYVSIKTHDPWGQSVLHWKNLHSTMYLLKQVYRKFLPPQQRHLHSTMYLLKLKPDGTLVAPGTVFTFHYVSIKTHSYCSMLFLHPIFTFHYVSIKTRRYWVKARCRIWFTFHYVSIKTRQTPCPCFCCKIYIPLCIY